MAQGIVKYAYNRSFQLLGVIWFAVSCREPEMKTGRATGRVEIFRSAGQAS